MPKKYDILLEVLLRSHLHSEDGLPITLFVHGMVLTGKAVPTSRYTRHMLTGVEEEGSVWDEIADTFKKHEDNFNRLTAQDPETLTPKEKKIVDSPPLFINLIEARFLGSDGRLVPTNRSVALRVKAASVDGWLYGELGASEA